MIRPAELIQRKRDGEELAADEISELILGYARGEILRRHFARVERRDVAGPVEFPDADAVRGYIASSVAHKHLAERVPELEGPLTATRVNAIFVAETAG